MKLVGWITRSGSTTTAGRNGGSAALGPPYELLTERDIFFAAAGKSL